MVDIRNISDLLFNHMEDKHTYPIAKVKLAIKKYETQLTDKLNVDNAMKIEFDNLYKNPRTFQNEAYEVFLQERENILKEWKHNKSKDSLKKLMALMFEFQDIPEIYTITAIRPVKERPKRPEPMEPANDNDIPQPIHKKLKECPPGKILNPVTKRCVSANSKTLKSNPSKIDVLPDSDKKLKECPPGKILNPDTKRCVSANSKTLKNNPPKIDVLPESDKKLKECPPGKILNPVTKRCVSANSKTLKNTNDEQSQKTQLYGFKNLGSSCYINTALQMLFHNKKINDIVLQSQSENPIVKAYVELYQSYLAKNTDTQLIHNLVNEVNNIIKNKEDKFNVKKQNDSSEFVGKLMEVFTDTLGDIFTKYTTIKMSNTITFADDIVIDNKNIKCLDVKKPNILESKSIIVPVTKNDLDISNYMNNMVSGIKEEITDEDNLYQCVKYKIDGKNAKKSDGEMRIPFTRTEQLMTTPDSLNLTIGVFGNDLLSKTKSNITVPNTLLVKDKKYLIKGIIVHYGKSMKSGHYTYLSYENNKWYEYSDDDIKEYDLLTEADSANVFKTNMKYPTPYMIYYEKI